MKGVWKGHFKHLINEETGVKVTVMGDEAGEKQETAERLIER